jgi:hypothetical protein
MGYRRFDGRKRGYAKSMEYVLVAILVLLIVAAGVTAFVLKATRAGRQSAAKDPAHGEGVPGSDAAIVAPDEKTPLGDTDQHAGEQTEEGRTVGGTEGDRSESPRESAPPAGEGGVGGEAEGGRPAAPESERLANRPR